MIDKNAGYRFLIDTGAEISLLPSHLFNRRTLSQFKLFAANNSQIDTFGNVRLSLDLGLRRSFVWNFCVAAVQFPIIGADFISHHGLMVDLHGRRLVDKTTKLSAPGTVEPVLVTKITTIDYSSVYAHTLADFPEITSPMQVPSPSREVEHHIVTSGPPVSERPRRLSPEKLEVAKSEFQRLVELGICRPSSSPWASPIHIVAKKDGKWRVCGDYRRLNSVTVPDKYPVPHLHDFAHNLRGKTIFSSLDLLKAFYQIRISDDDIPKTAVTTPFGLFEFVTMTFGLRNAAQSFQRYLHRALVGLDFVFVYIDDILIASSSPEEHKEHLRIVFKRLKDFGLRINPSKCILGVSEITFLGFRINCNGSAPTPDKVAAITSYPKPNTIVELRRFLGALNFYRRFLPHAASIQAPLLTHLQGARKNDQRAILWTPESEEAFASSKSDLAKAAMLSHPEMNASIRLVTDASDIAMGAALEQHSSKGWEPLAFFSRKFSPAQLAYSTYDRELTAIFESLKNFKHHLEGREFKILTDHKPLVYAFRQRSDKASPRQARQLSLIAQYTTNIEHVSGVENPVADALSRIESLRLPVEIELTELAEEQSKDEELRHLLQSSSSSLSLKRMVWGTDHSEIICELSGEAIRPYIPRSLRRRVFDTFHSPAHPSAKVTDRLIRQRYIWPNLHKDITSWSKLCIDCQKSKVSRHVKQTPSHFTAPDGRFDHVHMDIIVLPISDGYRYCLTMIDRFSRWPEAIPLRDISAPTVARAFYDHWVARYGAPRILTTDQGAQFESRLFSALLSLIGCSRIRTTAYHPAANGLVERWHRSLKAAIMCHANQDWVKTLSTVLIGLRSHVRLDTGASPAEFVFGTSLRLPGEFFLHDNFSPDPQIFLEDFRIYMRQIKPVPVAHHHKNRAFCFKDLRSCTHVFLRTDAVKKPLEQPYSGPFKILDRTSDQVYRIEIGGNAHNVSVERLKPAFFIPDIPDSALETGISDHSSLSANPTTLDVKRSQGLRTYQRKRVAFAPNS